MMRCYWPRIHSALAGLTQLPPVHDLYSYSGFSTALASPEIVETLDALLRASEASREVMAYTRKFAEQADLEGFPMEAGCLVHAPFDVLGDYFRGTKGIMLDMYRRPDMVVKACERLLPFLVDKALSAARTSANPRIFMPLHKGSDGFMSEAQFLRFYWPTLHEMMLAFIREGLVPCPFFEGECASRLHIIRDIPPGKACYNFENTDLRKAKAVLGDRVCLRGGVPGSLLVAGTPDQVTAYCKALLRDVAEEGGFILDATATLDDARPENVKAIFDSVRE
jgi:uroporphyrinogen-III decarboxylase